jgi:hypothetical protein
MYATLDVPDEHYYRQKVLNFEMVTDAMSLVQSIYE